MVTDVCDADLLDKELFFRCGTLGEKIKDDPANWEWKLEPHQIRRKIILQKYPEIVKLTGFDQFISFVVIFEVVLQILVAYLMSGANWVLLILLSYVISGTLNHSLGSAIHEIGHNLAFGAHRPALNRALGMIANLPLIVPMSVAYKRYHSDHHKFLLHQTLDVDVPTVIEAKFVRHPLAKFVWLFFHAAIHGIRPYFKSPKSPSLSEIINFAVQMSFNFVILRLAGVKPFVYLILGTLFGLGAHPAAGHFFSEHYSDELTTMSYYGSLNFLVFNVGYHNEHHDFPNVPYRRLPEIRRIASEFYDKPLKHHTSWLKVLYKFVFDYKQGPHAHSVGFKKVTPANGTLDGCDMYKGA